ncbi:cellulose-binding domain-containing protein [Sphaerisporangium corydalis]|uniref:Cellulose binding domain-containing protein n=1 Tax=Sphaerisporangium corydalis TaxID=1441875 RepID=A0ABV9EN91_9ACTN|nr:cellulose-binding domain-containing protein [Sphaerisporangium corydalis]
MNGRWAVSWAVAALVAAAFIIPAAASASSGGRRGAASVATDAPPPGSPSPSPSLLWPCYDPKTYPPSSPPLTPPTAPGTPEAVQVMMNYVRLRWGAATDPDGLACYQVYEDRDGTKTKVATFGPDVTEGTFTVNWPPLGTASRVASLYVVAVDRWGAVSPPSGTIKVTIYNDVVLPPTPTPTPSPSGACHVTYGSHGWSGGMTSSVSITNTGSTAITGWRLTFVFPDPGQRVSSGWAADWSQSGPTVTATALAWNREIAPGGGVTIGFNGANQGPNPAPATFQLNGATCR